MGTLRNLKGIDKYKKVSITNDFQVDMTNTINTRVTENQNNELHNNLENAGMLTVLNLNRLTISLSEFLHYI